MVEGLPDMEGWGILAICKEASRLLYKYMRLLLPFILAFGLPITLFLFLELIGGAWLQEWIAHHEPPHRFGGIFDHHHHHHHHHHYFGFHAFSAFSKTANDSQPLPPIVVRVLLLTFALIIVLWLLASLAIAAIAKAVQYIYSNNERDPAIVKSIFKSLPEAFFRIFITSLWIFLVDLITYFIVSLPFYLFSAANINPKLLESVYQASLFVSLLFVDLLFLISQQVAVLEPENYGLAALKRSVRLVQAKVPTALALFAIYLLIGFSHLKLSEITTRIPMNGSLPHWIVYVLAVDLSLLYLAFSAYWLVVMTVFYFASKLHCGAEEQLLPEGNPYQPLVVSTENEETHTSSLIG